MKVVHTEYGWKDAHQTCAHEYLLPAVQKAIQTIYRGEQVRILDIGCGNGYVASRLSELGYSVMAVDASFDGIGIARQAYPSVKFEVCSVYDDRLTELMDRSVDCVVALEVVEHLLYPKRLFEQSHKLLRKGGALVISTPYHGYLKNLAISLVNGWDRHFTVGWDGGHIKFFSKNTLARMACDAGFKKPQFDCVGRFPGLWKSMIMVASK